MLKQIDFNLLDVDMLPQATINREPLYFKVQHGIEFCDSYDDLDYFTAALLLLDQELLFALKRYRGNPKGVTSIYLPTNYRKLDQISEAVKSIMDALHLKDEDLFWHRKDTPDA
jgi:hypothetical protein